LAQTIRFCDCLQDGELPRRQRIAGMARKQTIRPLAGAMQKMEWGSVEGAGGMTWQECDAAYDERVAEADLFAIGVGC